MKKLVLALAFTSTIGPALAQNANDLEDAMRVCIRHQDMKDGKPYFAPGYEDCPAVIQKYGDARKQSEEPQRQSDIEKIKRSLKK